MKTIELDNYEVQEMNASELKETDGGFVIPLLVAVGVYMAYEIAANPRASAKAFMDGWNSI
jgi:hypothetical protein